MLEKKSFLRELRQSASNMTEKEIRYISGLLRRRSEQKNRIIRAGDSHAFSIFSGSARHTKIFLQGVNDGGKKTHQMRFFNDEKYLTAVKTIFLYRIGSENIKIISTEVRDKRADEVQQ